MLKYCDSYVLFLSNSAVIISKDNLNLKYWVYLSSCLRFYRISFYNQKVIQNLFLGIINVMSFVTFLKCYIYENYWLLDINIVPILFVRYPDLF